MTIVKELLTNLEKRVLHLPRRFYDSFDYTITGQNFTHPITLGILSRFLWELPEVVEVAIDLRLNDNEAKFQPDLVAIKTLQPFSPIAFIDYESPNSSDARIPEKDVRSYLKWTSAHHSEAPYIIITTLPNHPVPDWELRYTGRGKHNETFKGQRHYIANNPFSFWYEQYRRTLSRTGMENVHFINIDGNKVYEVTFP